MRTYASAPAHFHVSTFRTVWAHGETETLDEACFTTHDLAQSYARTMLAQHTPRNLGAGFHQPHITIVPCEQTRCTVYIGN